MKLKFLFLAFVCLSQISTGQTMKVYKTDTSTLDFALANIDSITFSTTPTGNVIGLTNFTIFSNEETQESIQTSAGLFSEASEGLVIYGSSTQELLHIKPKFPTELNDNILYLKWKLDGNANTCVELYSDSETSTKIQSVELHAASTASDSWYYTRISVSSNRVVIATSTDNYDNFGGNVTYTNSALLNSKVNNYSFTAKVGQLSKITLAESRIE